MTRFGLPVQCWVVLPRSSMYLSQIIVIGMISTDFAHEPGRQVAFDVQIIKKQLTIITGMHTRAELLGIIYPSTSNPKKIRRDFNFVRNMTNFE